MRFRGVLSHFDSGDPRSVALLASAGSQVRRRLADSAGAAEHDNVGGTKMSQLDKGRGRNAVLFGKEQRCTDKGRDGGGSQSVGGVLPRREIHGSGTLRVGIQGNRRSRLITIGASPPLHRGAGSQG